MRKIMLLCLMSFALLPISQSFALEPVIDMANLDENIAIAANTLNSYYQEAQMIINQENELVNWAKQLQDFNLHTITDISGQIGQIAGLAAEGEALTYATSHVAQTFDEKFGNQIQSIDEQNKRIMSTVLDTARGTLNSLATQMDDIQKASQSLDEIVTHSNAASGTKATIQASNQLLDATAAQLQALHQTVSQLVSQQATIAAADARKAQIEDQADETALVYGVEKAAYSDNDKLASIPNFPTS